MRRLKNKRPSTLLILLSSIVLCLGIVLAGIFYVSAENLKNDASIINEAGTVRGSIQRLSKLVVYEDVQNTREIQKNVDRIILKLENRGLLNQSNDYERNFVTSVVYLGEQWNELKTIIHNSSYPLDDETLSKLIVSSERCWHAANLVVYKTQAVTEEKVRQMFELFYLILIINAVSILIIILLIILSVRNRLEHDSTHDALTSLPNRRAFDVLMKSEAARNRRYKMPVSLILFDVDYFKKVNDMYGHRTGDRVLIELAQVVGQAVRKVDAVFRVGGEEFAIICADTNLPGALRVAEKVRCIIEENHFDEIDNLTVSMGVAELDQTMTVEQLYQHADTALYTAKKAGRNRSEVYSETESA